MSLPKTNAISIERLQKAEAFLDKLIMEYQIKGAVDERTLTQLKEMRQNFRTQCSMTRLWGC